MAIGAQNAAAEVSVQLSGCEKEDARALFTALGSAFASDREPTEVARAAGGGHPTVWSSVFDVSQSRGEPGTAVLHGSMTADIQGTPGSVAKLKATLGEVVSVRVESLAAGDQEQEVRLRLENR